jgi:hypothetical protein
MGRFASSCSGVFRALALLISQSVLSDRFVQGRYSKPSGHCRAP